MNTMHRWRLAIGGLATAFSLLACGGGSDTTAPAVVATPAPLTTNPGTVTPAPDAGAPQLLGNIALDGSNWINYRRAQAGVAELTENTAIDRAAQAHSDYQKINGVSHTEDPLKPGFTGVRLVDRLTAAGYALGTTYAVGEVIAATSNSSGFYMAEELITAIYHRFVMFEPVFREIGSGAATTASGYNYLTSNFGTASGFGPGLGAGKVVVWPFSGQTMVVPNFFSNQELPDPVAGQDEVGYPVSVHADINATLGVTSFTMRPRGGANLDVKLLTKALDPETPASAAAIIPLSPLAGATVYDVSFTGTAGGAQIIKSWSFTTR